MNSRNLIFGVVGIIILALLGAGVFAVNSNKSLSPKKITEANTGHQNPFVSAAVNESDASEQQKVEGTKPLGIVASPAFQTPSIREVRTTVSEKPSFPTDSPAVLVSIDGKKFQLTPNQLGHYPKMEIATRAKVPVVLSFPQNQPGDQIMVQVEDGGTLDQKAMATVAKLNNDLTAQFNFTATEQPGIYRLRIQSGSSVQVLSFWAGDEPALRQD